MTDLVTRAQDDTETTAISAEADAGDVQWAPSEPAPKKRRLWLWIGIPVGAVVLGAVATSLVLIAPGTTVAGVNIGFMTPGAATDAINARLASTEVVLAEGGGDAVVTGAELGAVVDGRTVAEESFQARPMWNVTQWFGEPIDATVTVDDAAAEEVLRAAAPGLYAEPADAGVAYDGGAESFTVAPAVDGAGVDIAALAADLQTGFDDGLTSVTVTPVATPIEANTTTAEAQTGADAINGMLDSIGFYIGEERLVPVDRATAASWFTLSTGADGAIAYDVDPAKIQPVVDTLPGIVNRAPVDSTAITNTSGTVLRTITAGQSGREVGDTSAVAADFAEQLKTGDAAFAIPVNEVAAQTNQIVRTIEVSLSQQRVYLKQNGAVVDSWLVSTGKGNTPTYTGNYTIGWKDDIQTMNGYDRDADGNITGTYSTPNVKWAMYFNGGQAFHGVYWHNNYGTPMSHGCVGMPEWRAKQLFDWAPQGVQVSIYR